jgi:hypothetical protein
MDQRYTQLAAGSQPSLAVTGKVTVNSFIANSTAPTLFEGNVSISTTGGSLDGGSTIYVAVCGTNSGKYTPPSNVIEVVIPPGTNTNKFTLADVSWSSTATLSGWALFAGTAEDTITYQSSGSGTPSTLSFVGPITKAWALPDPNFYALRVKYKKLVHAGVVGARVDIVTGSTIVATETVDPTGTDDWTGRKLILIGRDESDDNPGVTPLDSYNITAFDPSSGLFTLDRGAGDAQAGDAFAVSFQGYDNSGDPTVFTDSGISNSENYNPATNPPTPTPFSGLTADSEVGYVMRVIGGTGRGQTAKIVSNTSTSYTLDQALTLDTDSIVIVENGEWQDFVDSTATNNYDPTLATTLSVPTTNYLRQSMLIGGFTVDSGGGESGEADAVFRMVYIYGQQDAPVGPPQATFLFGNNSVNVTANTSSNLIIAPISGTFERWDAIAGTPPTGQNMTFDIYQNGSNIGTITLVQGVGSLQTGTLGSGSFTINQGDILYAKCTQVGSSIMGANVTLQLYWTPQAPAS